MWNLVTILQTHVFKLSEFVEWSLYHRKSEIWTAKLFNILIEHLLSNNKPKRPVLTTYKHTNCLSTLQCSQRNFYPINFSFKTEAFFTTTVKMNQNWDVTKYRSPHEPDYQWQLKKKFMEQVCGQLSELLPEARVTQMYSTFILIASQRDPSLCCLSSAKRHGLINATLR